MGSNAVITCGTRCPGRQCRIPHFFGLWGTRQPPAPRWPLPALWLGSAVPAHTASKKPSRQLQQIYLCSQFSTGLLLGPAKLLPQLELCAGREAQALLAGAALTSCWQGLKHPRPTSPGLPQTPQPGKHTVVWDCPLPPSPAPGLRGPWQVTAWPRERSSPARRTRGAEALLPQPCPAVSTERS